MTTKGITITTIGSLLVLSGLIVLGLWGCPQYNVYQQRKDGEAQLAHAQSSREVAVAEAKAKMESATLLAQADTIRAHGIARSNKIIGESLSKEYLHWFWIDNIDKSNNVIYVPTEANLPIMEATRGFKPVVSQLEQEK
jgi:regulator of protease activity HflC (stomatin/prohibitin superfamily)